MKKKTKAKILERQKRDMKNFARRARKKLVILPMSEKSIEISLAFGQLVTTLVRHSNVFKNIIKLKESYNEKN